MASIKAALKLLVFGISWKRLVAFALVGFGLSIFLLATFHFLRSWRAGVALGEEQSRVALAVQKMGGAGMHFIVVHGERNGPRNEIELNFREDPITDESLAHLRKLSGIVGIDLSKTKITDAGLDVFATLPDLKYLQLGDTTISDSGLQKLAACSKLSRLDLRRTRISAESSKILEKMPSLQQVYAKGTDLATVQDVTVNTSDELGPFFGLYKD